LSAKGCDEENLETYGVVKGVVKIAFNPLFFLTIARKTAEYDAWNSWYLHEYARTRQRPRLQLEQQQYGGFVKACIRHRVSIFALAALLFGTLAPCALHAQSAQDQSTASSSSTTPTPKSKKKKKDTAVTADATVPAATATPAAAPVNPTAASTATASKSQSAAKSTVQAQTPPSPGMVWVNTDSGAYHKAGSRWYGKTKQGKWMTEQEAVKAGYKPAKN